MDLAALSIPQEDTVLFVKCMAAVARADGEVSDEERQAIESAMLAWSIEGEAANAIQAILSDGGAIGDFVQHFSHPRTAFLLIHTLVTLASLDGQYDEVERAAILEIADKSGVSQGRVVELEQWANHRMACESPYYLASRSL